MKFNEAKKIVKDMERVASEIKDMVTIMGVYAINHYKKSFRDEGFTDDSLVRWQKRKKKRDDKGRGILTKSGRLRRSLVAKKMGRYAVRINSNVPYAVIHNEGGEINKEFDRRILSFGDNGHFAKTRTRKQRKQVSFQQQITINEHKIRIPKRQFVGYSSVLSRKIEKKLDSKIKKVFK